MRALDTFEVSREIPTGWELWPIGQGRLAELRAPCTPVLWPSLQGICVAEASRLPRDACTADGRSQPTCTITGAPSHSCLSTVSLSTSAEPTGSVSNGQEGSPFAECLGF